MPVKNKNGLTLSLEELEVKCDNSWESNNDEKAAKKIVNKHLVRLLNFIPGNFLDCLYTYLNLPVLLLGIGNNFRYKCVNEVMIDIF